MKITSELYAVLNMNRFICYYPLISHLGAAHIKALLSGPAIQISDFFIDCENQQNQGDFLETYVLNTEVFNNRLHF